MSKSKWLAAVTTAALAALVCATPADAALVVSNGATTNVNCADGVCSATAADAVMNIRQLRKMLGKADVELSSKSAMTDVVFQDAMSWSSAHALGVASFKAVVFNNHLVCEGGGELWLSLNDGEGGDLPTVGPKGKVEFWDLNSEFLINGNRYVLVGDIATLAANANQFNESYMALAEDYDAKRDGTYTSSPVPGSFNGRLEALGHTISNFKINSADGGVGLFADLYGNARIAHLHMENANVTATLDSARVGAIAGWAGGDFISVDVSGKVKGGENAIAGGIVGYYDTVGAGILTCSSSADVTVGGGIAMAGGLVGYGDDQMHITSSVARGTIKARGEAYAGGAIGNIHAGTVTDVHAFGAVAGGAATGGLVGLAWSSGSIVDSSAAGAVSGGGRVGGLVGDNQSLIDRSYATGAVQGGRNSVVGGVIGVNAAHVTNTYAVGVLSSAHGAALGGLVGVNHVRSFTPGQLENSYAAVTVGGHATNVGGVIGSDEQPSNHAHDYWDADTSGITDPSRGAGDVPNDGGLVAQTTGQLQAGLPNGLDSSIWGEKAGINNGFPYLLDNPPQ